MKKSDIIRAWRDPEFRATLTEAPASPAGLVELDDVALEGIGGARTTNPTDEFTNPGDGEVGISLTDTNSVCTVSGWRLSCGWVCTLTTECGC